jgi:hypothetical protein
MVSMLVSFLYNATVQMQGQGYLGEVPSPTTIPYITPHLTILLNIPYFIAYPLGSHFGDST